MFLLYIHLFFQGYNNYLKHARGYGISGWMPTSDG